MLRLYCILYTICFLNYSVCIYVCIFSGSTAYSAPEVLEGSETNMKSDLWSLGCILYYMYTGTDMQTDSN